MDDAVRPWRQRGLRGELRCVAGAGQHGPRCGAVLGLVHRVKLHGRHDPSAGCCGCSGVVRYARLSGPSQQSSSPMLRLRTAVHLPLKAWAQATLTGTPLPGIIRGSSARLSPFHGGTGVRIPAHRGSEPMQFKNAHEASQGCIESRATGCTSRQRPISSALRQSLFSLLVAASCRLFASNRPSARRPRALACDAPRLGSTSWQCALLAQPR